MRRRNHTTGVGTATRSTRRRGVCGVYDRASVTGLPPRSRAVCRRQTRSCPPPRAWAAAAFAGGRGGSRRLGHRCRPGGGLGLGLPPLRRVRQTIAVPGPHEHGVADHPLQRVAEPAPRQRLLNLRPGQPRGLLPQQRQDGGPERGLWAGPPGRGGRRQLLFQRADPP